MEGFSRPGRTAPLFADDIRRYDPRHLPPSNYNLLADIPPIRTDYELVSPSSCPHQYVLKPRQTFTPPFNGNEAANVEYRVSAVCAFCRQHLDLIIVYPTPWGHHGTFPHHLIYIPDAARETLQKVDRNPFRKGRPPRQEFHFQSTYSQHPVHVTVIVTEPFLSDAHVRVLNSVQRQEERVEAARLENPEKFMGLEVPSVKKTISILRKYVENAIQEDKRGRSINANGKTFTLSFGPRGDTMKEIFEYLGFTYVTSGHNNQDCFWQPPEPSGSSKAPLQDPELVHLDNLSYELFALQLSRPESEQGLYASELFEWASAHINRLLGIPMHIPRDQTWAWVNDNPLYGQSPDFRYFYDLGVLRTASPEEVIEAYNRQCVCDPDHRRRMYYMRCLGKIGQVMAATGDTRVSKALQEEYNKNKYSDEDLDLAYQVLGFNTYDKILPTVESITTVYKQKLRSNPSAAESFRPFLLKIADYKGSNALLDVANMPFPTYEKALQYLGAEKETPDDFVISMFTTKLLDSNSPESLTLAREALGVIAEERSSDMLEQYLKTGEISESEMDVGKALALLQSPPEADDSSIMAAYHSCCFDSPGRVMEFEKALDVISKDRGRDVRTSETDPDSQPKPSTAPPPPAGGRADWPVGLNNIANTCYLNSLLQFYFTITPFREMILNYPEYLTDLDRDSIRKKKVGSRLVLKEEVKRSQRWMKKMSELFKEMITSPYAAITPTKLLAALTLYRSSLEYANARKDSVTSPSLLPAAAPDASLTNIDEEAANGPLGPPVAETKGDEVVKDIGETEKAEVAEDNAARTSMDSDATAVTNEGPEGSANASTDKMDLDSEDTYMKDVDSEEKPNGHNEITFHDTEKAGNDSQYPVEPPSRDPPAVPEEDEDAEIPLEYGAQQDVTEVISNLMFQAQCAIKPEGFASDGEQEDLIKSLFYGKTKTYIQTPKGLRSQEELFNDIKINVASGPQSLYNALDYAHDFQTVSIEDGEAEQYATLSQIPPILQIQVQRVQYDLEKQQAFKSNNHLELKETIYMDRYMDNQDPKIIERRRKVKGWKNQLEALDARRKRLVEFDSSSSVMDALAAARAKIDQLEPLKDDSVSSHEGISIPSSTAAEISELEDLTRNEIAAIDRQMASLRNLVDHEFDDMQELTYRLYAVFIHSGQVSYGHYWIYIYDFDRKIWRKYNDDYVTEVANVSEIYNEDPRGIASPYFVVYVKDDTRHTLVQPVVRDMIPLQDTAPSGTAEGSAPSNVLPEASSSGHPSDQSSENKTVSTSTDLTGSDSQKPPSRGRSPPPSYDDITSAGTLPQDKKYSYTPSQCFYQDDDVRYPAPASHELGNSGEGGVTNHLDPTGSGLGTSPAVIAAATALANADVVKPGSPAVMSTSSSRSSKSTNPFRRESSIARRMPGESPSRRAFLNDIGTNGAAAAGAGTESKMAADANAEWWNDDRGLK